MHNKPINVICSDSTVIAKDPLLIVFETHPIQYRSPIYQELERLNPGFIEVVYASDFSTRGYVDKDFGSKLAWDTPLLVGYKYRVLNNESKMGIKHWSGLRGRGIDAILKQARPKAILISSFGYIFNWIIYMSAVRYGIPIWIRVETQDQATERGPIKAYIRSVIYKSLYKRVAKAFYIGSLNRAHLIKHGLAPNQLEPALYCTPNPARVLSADAKGEQRSALRHEFGIPSENLVIGFFGKFIRKKNPEIIFKALEIASDNLQRKVTILLVGSGELETTLKALASNLEKNRGIKTIFAGFVNQSKLTAYYLASDIVILPSRKDGETWGLVVNEALQAGCAAIMSNAVGCSADFKDFERVRVVAVADQVATAQAIVDLAKFPHSFTWAETIMKEYSVKATSDNINLAVEQLR